MIFRKSTFIKSLSYRLYSSFITIVIAFVCTGNWIASISIGLLDNFIKVFSYYFFDEIWYRVRGFKAKPAVVWLTGLSGAGKTTIAYALKEKLNLFEVSSVILDGDEIRTAIKLDGYDEESRKKHNRNVGYIASLFEKQGNVVIVALVSPYADVRNEVRNMCSNFIEVYVSTSLEVCKQRDNKGLYKKAIRGEIKNFTGISAPYEAPQNPELVLTTDHADIQKNIASILKLLKKN
jgi:adenylyl-sulfate kinase